MKRALVVDDTKNIRNLLTTCLELEGYTVEAAADGKHAIEILLHEPFDLVFLDIKLPEISGTEVLRTIRAAGVQVPVIIMTAFATVKNAVDCTRLGAVAYMQKPFSADKIKHVLQNLDMGVDEEMVPRQEDEAAQAQRMVEERKYEEALQLLQKAIAKQPANASVYKLFARTYREMGREDMSHRFEQAAEAFAEGEKK